MSAAGYRTSVPRSRRWITAAVAAVALVPLAGCAAGVRAETSRERPTIDGLGSAIGTLSIRNAYVGGPAQSGGSAPVLLSVFNNGPEPDRLVSISSPEAAAGSVPSNVTLPPGGQQRYYTPGNTAQLTGLTTAIAPGQIVPVVLTFERAGQLRMSLPVTPIGPEFQTSGSASASPSATPSASGTPSPSASPSTSASPSASPSASIAP